MAAEYELTYLGTTPCGEGVASFRFSKPEGYAFSPGQFFSLSFETRDGVETKHFSHADAPGDPYVELTTRLSGSAFKDGLLSLEPATPVWIAGPKGHLGVPEGAKSVGFLAGGVGITPAHSIIRDAALRGSGLEIALMYGNRDESCIPYGDEFRGYVASLPGFVYVETLDHPTADWDGESGFISADLVGRHLGNSGDRHWIVAGPPLMVDAMRRVVGDLNLPDGAVSYEVFAGYDRNESDR